MQVVLSTTTYDFDEIFFIKGQTDLVSIVASCDGRSFPESFPRQIVTVTAVDGK